MFGHKHHGGRCSDMAPAGWWGFRHSHHGWGGPGRGRGFGPPFGGPGRGRRFGRGDLKYVILDLLKDQPRHGYDVIRALEERFHGFYSPSPGSVYPTLQLLEDQGYVTSSERDGKRVYVITDEGQRFLAERADVIQEMRERVAAGWGSHANPEVRQLIQEVGQIGQFLFQQGMHGALRDQDRIRQLRDVVARTRRDIEAIFGSGTSDSTMV